MYSAISHWALPGGSKRTVRHALRDAREAGLSGLELVVGTDDAIKVDTPKAECEELRRAIQDSGIRVESVATGLAWRFSPTHVESAVRQKAIALQRAALERAAWLGCRSFLIVPGAVTIPWDRAYPPVPYTDATRWAGDAIASLLPVARDLDIEICVENVENGLFYSPVEFAAFVGQFPADTVGIYLDVGNLMAVQQDPVFWIEYMGKRIRRMHFKDFSLEKSKSCPLNHGDVPWARVMGSLRTVGYDSSLVAEVSAGTTEMVLFTRLALDAIMAL